MSTAGESKPFAAAAEEAVKLVDALGEWLASAKLADWLPGAGVGPGAAGADCRLCPLCQMIGLLRHARPEIVEHLDDAAGSLLAALRLALESADRGRGERAPSFERIDIG